MQKGPFLLPLVIAHWAMLSAWHFWGSWVEGGPDIEKAQRSLIPETRQGLSWGLMTLSPKCPWRGAPSYRGPDGMGVGSRFEHQEVLLLGGAVGSGRILVPSFPGGSRL